MQSYDRNQADNSMKVGVFAVTTSTLNNGYNVTVDDHRRVDVREDGIVDKITTVHLGEHTTEGLGLHGRNLSQGSRRHMTNVVTKLGKGGC